MFNMAWLTINVYKNRLRPSIICAYQCESDYAHSKPDRTTATLASYSSEAGIPPLRDSLSVNFRSKQNVFVTFHMPVSHPCQRRFSRWAILSRTRFHHGQVLTWNDVKRRNQHKMAKLC